MHGRFAICFSRAICSAGADSTTAFEEIGHSDQARAMAEKYEIGVLEGWEDKAYGTKKRTSHEVCFFLSVGGV